MKKYSIDEVEEIHVEIVKRGCLYEGGDWSSEHERLVRLEFKKWKEQELNKSGCYCPLIN